MFIELTGKNSGRRLIINTNRIMMISDYDNETTIHTNEESSIVVKETIEEVRLAIARAQRPILQTVEIREDKHPDPEFLRFGCANL